VSFSFVDRGSLIVIAAFGALLLIATGSWLFITVFSGKDREFTFRQHWGGFGGTSTGWHASPPLVKFIAGAITCSLGVCTLVYLLQLQGSKSNEAQTQPPAATEKPATPGSPKA
jgi:hypothetical protein